MPSELWDKYGQQHQDKKTEMDGLRKRHVKDQELFENEEYKLTDNTNQEVPDVIHITGNEAATFGHKVISNIVGADQQFVVEGFEGDKPLSDERTTEIEESYEAVFRAADERMQNRGITSVKDFNTQQICIRGSQATRCTLREEDGKLVADILPVDTHFLTYEFSENGLVWVAHELNKTKAVIEDEYKEMGVTNLRDKTGQVLDVWTPEREITFINNEDVTRPENGAHDYEEVPWIIQLSTAGSMLQGKKYYEKSGESIYGMNRLLYNELNRAASILQTQNMLGLFPHLQYKSAAGGTAVLPEKSPYGIRKVTAVEVAGGFDKIPAPDMLQCSRFIWAILQMMIQRGGLPAIDYGNLTFPLSAVAIKQLTQTKDAIYIPRLHPMSISDQMLCRMIRKQFEKKNLTLKTSSNGKSRTITKANFAGDYTVNFNYTTVSPEQDIANYSVAAGARGLIPDEDILRDIIKVKSPGATINRVRAEAAYRESPILRKYSQAKAFIALGQENEARMVATEIGILIDDIKNGAPEGKKPEAGNKEPQPESLIPLLGQGSGRSAGRPEDNTQSRELERASGVRED